MTAFLFLHKIFNKDKAIWESESLETINFIGSAASVIGLIISISLIFITKGARKAAQEARELAYGKNILNELDDIKSTLNQCKSEIDKGHRNIIIFLITETLNLMSAFKSKRAPELKNRNNAILIISELKGALEVIGLNPVGMLSDDEKQRVHLSVNKILQNINEEIGHFDGKLSRESS